MQSFIHPKVTHSSLVCVLERLILRLSDFNPIFLASTNRKRMFAPLFQMNKWMRKVQEPSANQKFRIKYTSEYKGMSFARNVKPGGRLVGTLCRLVGDGWTCLRHKHQWAQRMSHSRVAQGVEPASVTKPSRTPTLIVLCVLCGQSGMVRTAH